MRGFFASLRMTPKPKEKARPKPKMRAIGWGNWWGWGAGRLLWGLGGGGGGWGGGCGGRCRGVGGGVWAGRGWRGAADDLSGDRLVKDDAGLALALVLNLHAEEHGAHALGEGGGGVLELDEAVVEVLGDGPAGAHGAVDGGAANGLGLAVV